MYEIQLLEFIVNLSWSLNLFTLIQFSIRLENVEYCGGRA